MVGKDEGEYSQVRVVETMAASGCWVGLEWLGKDAKGV
jgi:hypothetical protein